MRRLPPPPQVIWGTSTIGADVMFAWAHMTTIKRNGNKVTIYFGGVSSIDFEFSENADVEWASLKQVFETFAKRTLEKKP